MKSKMLPKNAQRHAGSVKSENSKGKGKLGNGKLKNKIINYDKLIN